jgi:long-subunit acyl-CoA synthetase (AMP-forming)
MITKIKDVDLSDDVDALGTFLVYNGLKGKNIAIMGGDFYECTVSYLSVVCGTGVAVPLDEEWSLHRLKRYINATDCSCIIFSEAVEDVVWELYNDGVTPLQTFIRMGDKNTGSQFISMEEAINEGKDCIAFGNRDFFDAQIAADDLAVIQFESAIADAPKPALLTHGNILAFSLSLDGIIHADENEVFFSPLPISDSLKRMCGLLSSLYNGSPVLYEDITAQTVTLNSSSDSRSNEFVGRALPGIVAKIADADPKTGVGEILFRGSAVTTGYYNKPDYDTLIYSSPIKDGWYYTGHRGIMDENGYIHVFE